MTTPTTDPAGSQGRRFGRVEQTDERNSAYGIAEHLEAAGAPASPVTHSWDTPDPIPLDQGNTVHCVPFAGVQHRIAEPVETPGQTNTIAHSLYERCKAVDGLGRNVQGTSVLAIAKVFKADGIIDEYRWCNSEQELALTVSQVAPVVIGVQWRSGMMDPDADGFLHVSGSNEGGHCVLVVGINVEAGYYDILCAWGHWGYDGKGRAKIRRADMAGLLANGGDACVLIEHPLPGDPDPDAPTDTTDTPTPTPTPTPAPAPQPKPRPKHHRWVWPFNRRVISRR